MRWLAVLAMFGCGGAAPPARTTPHYAASSGELLQIALDATAALYGVGAADVPHREVVTRSFRPQLWDTRMQHRGWPSDWVRGGWSLAVQSDGLSSWVVIRGIAQRSLTSCARCEPRWIDVPPDDVGLAPALDDGSTKLARAIDQRVQALRR